MKKRLIIFTLICAALFTACSGSGGADGSQITAPVGGEAETEPVTEPVTESVIATAETSAPDSTAQADVSDTVFETTESGSPAQTDNEDNEEAFYKVLYGPNMDKISEEDITKKEISEDGRVMYVKCDGFVYLAEPTGACFNSVENPDLFDGVNFVFKGSAPSAAVYKRYNVGDSICGLTVATASTVFMPGMTPSSHEEKYFNLGSVTFDGSASLTGYLIILTDYEYAVGDEGDVIFIPDGKSQTLPILNYNKVSDERGVYSDYVERCFSLAGLAYQSEYPFVHCGNVSNYGSAMFAHIEENTPTPVRITIDNIIMNSSIEWFAKIAVTIDEMDIL